MTLLVLIGAVMWISAAVALAQRNLIRLSLCLILTWVSGAAFYLYAGAEFIAFVQVFVYVGAISMVVLFAVLLTRVRPGEEKELGDGARISWQYRATGVFAALMAGAVIVLAIRKTPLSTLPLASSGEAVTLRRIGEEIATGHAPMLALTAVLLTAALIGAVVLAASRDNGKGGRP